MEWGVSDTVEGYLLTSAQNLGWTTGTGFGPSPLTWAEIDAYARCTGDLKEPWEFQTIRDMSMAYIVGYQSDSTVDPAEWTRYKGLMMPIVLPLDAGRVKVTAKVVET